MGATEFKDYGVGKSPAEALQVLVWAAENNNGSGGYTGTIAEKGEYVMVREAPMKHLDAEQLADDLMEADDPCIADKWGPAGCIPIKPAVPGPVSQWLFFGLASC